VVHFNISEPHARSNSVTVVGIESGDAAALRTFTKEVCGVTVGGTIGELSGKGIRIAHMCHVSAVMLLGTLSSIELGFEKLAIPYGKGGIHAAIDYLAQAI